MRQVLPCGDRALLVELGDLEEVMAFDAALRASSLPWIDDIVPAARTVLVRFDPRLVGPAEVVRHLRWLDVGGSAAIVDVGGGAATPVEIPVVYDGEDLDEVADLLGLTPADLVERHHSGTYRVAFVGFAPGFAYMVGASSSGIDVPRRSTPRTAVPAGSVALAGGYCGIYPRDMPGGWQLIGRTTEAVWDERRDPPALLRPGDIVRFRVEDRP